MNHNPLTTRNNNNFDFIRFFAALIVMLAHSYYLVDTTDEDILIKYLNIGINLPQLGVSIFFVISGYLIIKSALSSKSVLNYIWKRFLRIFPGLFVALIFTVFIIGPLVTETSLKNYFTSANTYSYFINLSLFKGQSGIEYVFSSFSCKTVNGSLWTLAYEFSFYILVLSLLPFKIFTSFLKGIPLITLFILLTIRGYLGDKFYWYNYSSPYLLGLYINSFFNFGLYFLSGMVFYFYEEKIKSNKTIFIILLAFLSGLIFTFKQFELLPFILIPVIIFSLSFIKGKLNHFGKHGDFSYGMYIYAYPIQQSLIYFLGPIHPMYHFVLSASITFPLAYFSWNLIEKRALSLKDILK